MLLRIQQRITWQGGVRRNNLCFREIVAVATLAKISKWPHDLSLAFMENWNLIRLAGKASWLWRAESGASSSSQGYARARSHPLCDRQPCAAFPSSWPESPAWLQLPRSPCCTPMSSCLLPSSLAPASSNLLPSPAFMTCRRPTEAVLQLIPQKSLHDLLRPT